MVDNQKCIHMIDNQEQKKMKAKKTNPGFIKKFKAKKDWYIDRNEDKIEIKKNEEYDNIPVIYEQTLKTEKII